MSNATIRVVLNELEKREMPLLSWGVTNGTFSEDEVIEVLSEIAPAQDPDELLDLLLKQGLLVAKGISGGRYRSRMAETVRLSIGLRQWFHGQPWQTAPSLVSDARFVSQARVVPLRDQAPDRLARDLSRSLGTDWTPEHEAALHAVLAGRSVSAFQARSTLRLLSPSASGMGRATCITAGTGSGKTLAFYLPALTRILSSPTREGVPRVVAIYPRTELLRDQLRGLLLTTQALADAGLRRPRVGVLYGASPRDRRDAKVVKERGWKQQPDGLRCPIIGCLNDGCDGTYLWPESAGDTERLVCGRCGALLDGESLSFLRNRLRKRPPEILFTTTEMVNRLLGSAGMRRLLVGDASRSPEFLLLDEVHTYAGTHGAQVANLLRRWRAEMSNATQIVGLSATLADPAGFFAELVGLTTSNVTVVVPAPEEMTEVGREYFLALRGDPASQTSLLSTTIQTSMLLRRMLDASPGEPSEGAFGSRLFVFTDDLDVVNRLHSQLEDAEGWQPGGVNRQPNGSLAMLRAPGADARARDEAGQVWDVADELGTLNRLVKVSRTTSKDAGVDADADIVVATASLEVGFDDPLVGAVLQHKAPRDAAQFLQRRGRAGRDPTMRPWTVVVLSDYGRDRLAFQAYETLFDPVVRPTHLPLRNRVIQKMQATWWLLDYLSKFSSGTSVASLLSRRWRDNTARQRQVAGRVLEVVRETITPTGIERLSVQLRKALALPEEDLQSVLWDHPRALVTAVLPTIARRLEALTSTAPLPEEFAWVELLAEFVPSSLFASLQTPEVDLILPGRFGAASETEAEPISQALRQFAPGRVSYRYALGGKRERMWMAPPSSLDPAIRVEEFCSDYIDMEVPANASVGRLVQPTALELTRPGRSVSDSSYGTWEWRAAFRLDGTPLTFDVPTGAWAELVVGVQALTHRHRCPLTVWRFAEGFEVDRQARSVPTRHALTLDGEPAGVGFAMEVDGLIIDVVLPEAIPDTRGLLSALRVARMEYLVRSSPLLAQQVPSSFLRDWLSQVLLSVLVTEAGDGQLADAIESLTDDDLRTEMVHAGRNVFGADATNSAQNAHGAPHDPGLVTDIAAALQSPDVLAGLRQAARALYSDPDQAWLPWLRERFMITFAAALIDAIQAACPDVDVSDLRPDFEILPNSEGRDVGRIRISEDQPGGTGVIEALVDRYVEDPRTFWALVTAALGPCDGERVDRNLRAFLRATDHGPLTGPVDETRIANDLQSLTSAWADLRKVMFGLGLDVDQSIGSALATRLLRPGSSRELESLVADLLDRWDSIEGSLGVEIDLRVFAFIAADDPAVRTRLQTAAQRQGGQRGWEIGQIVGLLWTRGGRLRAASLQSYTPYAKLEPTERLLFDHITQVPDQLVSRESPGWRQELDEALRRTGSATLRATTESDAADAIRDLLTEPTNVGVLEFHPRIVGLTRSVTGIDLMVDLREAHQ